MLLLPPLPDPLAPVAPALEESFRLVLDSDTANDATPTDDAVTAWLLQHTDTRTVNSGEGGWLVTEKK
jgi:hypothetical protein